MVVRSDWDHRGYERTPSCGRAMTSESMAPFSRETTTNIHNHNTTMPKTSSTLNTNNTHHRTNKPSKSKKRKYDDISVSSGDASRGGSNGDAVVAKPMAFSMDCLISNQSSSSSTNKQNLNHSGGAGGLSLNNNNNNGNIISSSNRRKKQKTSSSSSSKKKKKKSALAKKGGASALMLQKVPTPATAETQQAHNSSPAPPQQPAPASYGNATAADNEEDSSPHQHLNTSATNPSFLNTPSAPRVSNPSKSQLSLICPQFNSIHGCPKANQCQKQHCIILSQRKMALLRNLERAVMTRGADSSSAANSASSAAASNTNTTPNATSFWNTPNATTTTGDIKTPNASFPTFAQLPFIHPHTKKALKILFKYKHMTMVQSRTITQSHIQDYLERDCMVKAKTGSGKTLAFLIPAIEILLHTRDQLKDTIYAKSDQLKQVSVLVLSPTRELVIQTEKEAQKLLGFHPDIKCKAIIGGTKNIQSERSNFENHFIPDILIATPGRFHDHLLNTNGFVKHFKKLRVLVMDEADQLLDQGFKDALLEIFQFLPSRVKRQTLMLSATIPPAVKSIARQAMKPKYEFINCVEQSDVDTNATLTQQYMPVTLSTILPVLYTLLEHHVQSTPNYKIIVFLPTANQAEFFSLLFQSLKMQNYAMHSKKEQSYRRRISDLFRSESNLIMFSSDVSARGVDYPNVSLIIQVGVPSSMDQYVHRIGRTARAGKCGTGIILLCKFEEFFWKQLKEKFKKQIQQLTPLEIPLATQRALNKTIEKSLFSVNQKSAIAASKAYVSFLGFYRQFMRRLQWNNEQLVAIGNEYASHCLGVEEPSIPHRTAVNLKMDGVRGLRIQEGVSEE